jgi:hypothetical protein
MASISKGQALFPDKFCSAASRGKEEVQREVTQLPSQNGLTELSHFIYLL